MGSYVVFINTTATLDVTAAFQAPDVPGVQFNDVFGVWIAGSGGLDSVVNGTGGPVASTNPGTVVQVDVVGYHQGRLPVTGSAARNGVSCVTGSGTPTRAGARRMSRRAPACLRQVRPWPFA